MEEMAYWGGLPSKRTTKKPAHVKGWPTHASLLAASADVLYLLFSAYSAAQARARARSASARSIAAVTCGAAVPP